MLKKALLVLAAALAVTSIASAGGDVPTPPCLITGQCRTAGN